MKLFKPLFRPLFVLRTNRSTEYDIFTALHSVATHLEDMNSYIRMLFVHFSWALSSVSPMKLIGKLTTPATRFLDFLTNRHETVGIGSHTYSTLVLTTSAPEGCVFSPLSFMLYSHDRTPRHQLDCKACRQHHCHLLHYKQRWHFTSGGNQQSGAQRTIYRSTWTKPRVWFWILEIKEAKTHTNVYISGAEVEKVNGLRNRHHRAKF